VKSSSPGRNIQQVSDLLIVDAHRIVQRFRLPLAVNSLYASFVIVEDTPFFTNQGIGVRHGEYFQSAKIRPHAIRGHDVLKRSSLMSLQ